MKITRHVARIALGILISAVPASGATHYVKVSAVGTGDCSDWANACTLASALAAAASSDEIWVAAGTYNGTIALVNGVKLIGGFLGTETMKSQSDPMTNETVLDGGGAGPVVTSTDDASSTMLRGFRITNGHDDAPLKDNGGGGGAALTNSSAMIVQCVFDNNSSATWGGAVAVKGSGSPQFINCTFDSNGAVDFGSGVVTPHAGGGVYIKGGSPWFTNCLFNGNKAREAGAIAVASGAPKLYNCTITANESTVGFGGGLFDPLGATAVFNSISWGNTALRGNKEVENYAGRVSGIVKSDVEGGFVGTGNINADPQFEAPGGSNYKLSQSSPCKNAGQTAALPADVADLDWDGNTTEKVPLDLGGDPRNREFVVDMGAYETPVDPGPQ